MLTLLAAVCLIAPQDQPVTDAERAEVLAFLRTYQSTPYAERGQFVLDPETFKKVQDSYYEDRPHLVPSKVQIDKVKRGPKDGYLLVTATIVAGRDAVALTSPVVKTDKGWRLDWSAATGYNALSMKAFKAARGNGAAEFRAKANLSDLYLGAYRDAKTTHYAVTLEEEFGKSNATLRGYVERNSAAGKAVFSILSDGQPHKIIVEVRDERDDLGSVVITKVMSETWVR